MWWLFFALIFLTVLVILLLWIPVIVDIDTERQLYEARWGSLVRFTLEPDASGFHWYVSALGWKKELKRGKAAVKRREQPKKKPEGGEGRRFNKRILSRAFLRTVWNNLRWAIRVERLRIATDTGDYVLNAWLYPLFRQLSARGHELEINFLGQQVFALCLYTRPCYVAWAGLRVFLTLKR